MILFVLFLIFICFLWFYIMITPAFNCALLCTYVYTNTVFVWLCVLL